MSDIQQDSHSYEKLPVQPGKPSRRMREGCRKRIDQVQCLFTTAQLPCRLVTGRCVILRA